MKKVIIVIVLLLVGAFMYWTVSPLFIDKQVDDELPEILINNTNDSTAAESPPMTETFPIVDTTGHPASGSVRVLTGGQNIIRYEDYDGTNGPDLYVYLAKDLDAKEFVSLGRAKGNQGNINYPVPEEVDISEYKYVMTWCQAFNVLFDYAEIN